MSDEEYIVIHISGSTKEQFLKESEEKGIDFFSMEHENGIVSPSSVMTVRGVLLTEAFISSFDFAKENSFRDIDKNEIDFSICLKLSGLILPSCCVDNRPVAGKAPKRLVACFFRVESPIVISSPIFLPFF